MKRVLFRSITWTILMTLAGSSAVTEEELVGQMKKIDWLRGYWKGTIGVSKKTACQARVTVGKEGSVLTYQFEVNKKVRFEANISFDPERKEYRLAWKSDDLGAFEAGGTLEASDRELVFWRRPKNATAPTIRLVWEKSGKGRHKLRVRVDRGMGPRLELSTHLSRVPAPPKPPKPLEPTARDDSPSPLASYRAQRTKLLRKYGGRGTREAVDRGLRWLANHQDPETGAWCGEDFQARCHGWNTCQGKAESPQYDVGQTGLALLAFLAGGETHQNGSYQKTVKRGIKYLTSAQDAKGCIGPATGHFMYNHAIATNALIEAYDLTGDPSLKTPATRALEFLLRAQNPGFAWRYSVQPGDNDTSVTGWATEALLAGKRAGFLIPGDPFARARKWFDSVTDDQYYRTGYCSKGDRGARHKGQVGKFSMSEACTAISLAYRASHGEDLEGRTIRGQSDLLLSSLPDWNPKGGPGGTSKIDFYYWYHGTRATFFVGGDAWDRWNPAVKQALLNHQRGEEKRCEAGSWDPVGAWGSAQGRVGTTSLALLTLQIYHRHPRK